MHCTLACLRGQPYSLFFSTLPGVLLFQFVNEEALACELAAHFYLDSGETEKSMQHFLLAYERYLEWGALGKCDSIFKFMQSNVTAKSQDVVCRHMHSNSNLSNELKELENAQWERFFLEQRQKRS